MKLNDYKIRYGILNIPESVIEDIKHILSNGLHKNLKNKINYCLKYKLHSITNGNFWNNFHIKTIKGIDHVLYQPDDDGKRAREMKGIREYLYEMYDDFYVK